GPCKAGPQFRSTTSDEMPQQTSGLFGIQKEEPMSITRRDILRSAGAISGASIFPPKFAFEQSREPSRTIADTVNLFDFEPLARAALSSMAWEYISGGAGDEVTLRWNRESFDRIKLRPRILVDVSKLSTRIKLFGHEYAFPILLAPTAYQRMLHP